GRACPATDAATGSVGGEVLDISTRVPLQQVEVTIGWSDAPEPEERPEEETDARGTFLFCDIPAGARVLVRAEYLNEVDLGRPIAVEAGEHAAIQLELDAPHIVITGRVVEAGSGGEIAAAVIRLRDTPLSVATDEDGRFALRTVPPGVYNVDVEHLAYTNVADSIVAAYGANLELLVRMAPDAIPLEPLTVTVRSLLLERNGFYTRQERGHGTFLTRNEIGRVMALQASDVLRTVSGIRLQRRSGGFGMMPVGRGNCGFRYFHDGVREGPRFEIDDIPPEWIEALEIYKGASTVPIEFSPFMHEARGSCGLIVIWTKDRV
ncbi:MAG: carboxypeptidase regulatory-like domain-containing protein, partial [Longimicrobiales bacterium]